MRLLQSVLTRLKQTKAPQRKFVTHLFGLLLMLPGHATFRNMSRYSPYHERTFARWYDTNLDWVALNKAAIIEIVPADHEQALIIDASFVSKSGKHTYGLDRFWNGSHSRAEKGLEISALAWLDLTEKCAYGLSVEQTPPSPEPSASESSASESSASDISAPETTRMDVYLDQLRRVVKAHDLTWLRYLLMDGAYSKQNFVDGVRDLGLHPIGKLRADANMRYLYQGPKRPGPGRPKTYDGKVDWSDLSRFERLDTEDEDIVLYHQVLNHVQLKRNLQVVVVVHTQRKRYAVLFSTDVDLDALKLYRYYKARFQIEFLWEHSVILTPHREAFYNREKLVNHPVGKDSPWDKLRFSRYPRFVQENNGTTCAKTSISALTSGLMTSKHVCLTRQAPYPRSATWCGSYAKTSRAVSLKRCSTMLTHRSTTERRPLVPSVSGASRLALP